MAEAAGDNPPTQSFGLQMGTSGMTFGVAPVAGPSGIQMDTSKAMSILGFSSSQTFESVTMDEIQNAFTYRMNNALKAQVKKGGYNAR